MQATSYSNNFSRNARVAQSLREPLTDDQIRQVAPSVFAVEPHSSRGDRYGFIPTGRVLEGLRREGFHAFSAMQTRVRIGDREGFTKHLLRLRQIDHLDREEFNEVVLVNSHDGTSSYQLMAGTFRVICKNGMVAGGEIFNEIRTRHSGDVVGQVIEGAYEIVREFPRLNESIADMKSIVLTEPQQLAFARSALALKYDEGQAPITEAAVIAPRRSADRDPTLWNTLNRAQENLLAGGVRGRSSNGRRTSTRAVTGIQENVKLNRALWMLAESMKQLAQ